MLFSPLGIRIAQLPLLELVRATTSEAALTIVPCFNKAHSTVSFHHHRSRAGWRKFQLVRDIPKRRFSPEVWRSVGDGERSWLSWMVTIPPVICALKSFLSRVESLPLLTASALWMGFVSVLQNTVCWIGFGSSLGNFTNRIFQFNLIVPAEHWALCWTSVFIFKSVKNLGHVRNFNLPRDLTKTVLSFFMQFNQFLS